jgi:hypothetical protein
MPEIDPLRRIPFLYHFTDRRNLQLIRQMGGLYPLAELEAQGVEIPEGDRGQPELGDLFFPTTCRHA